jgi:NADPH:quinone reductase-like Zn-dependent oxidoreductase
MKAAIIGGPTQPAAYGDFAEPTTSDGGELVDLVAAGIHPVVRAIASGRHYASSNHWPLIPGVDAVARTATGELVYTGNITTPYGTLAERMAISPGLRIPLPHGADPVQVAAGINPGLSSWLPLTARASEIGTLGTVLVLGATGIAGGLAVQNAFALGATRVVGVGRNRSALAGVADHGATTVALSGDKDADAAAIGEGLAGDAPSIVLDFVWGAPAEATFAALARRGAGDDNADIAYVEIGSMAGADAVVPAALLRSRRIRMTGSGAGSSSISDIVVQLPAYLAMFAAGRVTVPVRTFPLSSAAEAWEAAAAGGKRVVVVPG